MKKPLLFCILILIATTAARAQLSPDPRAYDASAAQLTDLYVSPQGSDSSDGTTRDQALQTLGAAWARIPEGPLTGTGYRINLMPGEFPCEGDCLNAFGGRHGTPEFPIILQAVDGPGTVVVPGGLHITDASYMYLVDLTLRKDSDAPRGEDPVFYCAGCDHLLLRGLTIQGPPLPAPEDAPGIQEVVRITRSQYVYLEGNDISGAAQTGVTLFSVQYGHVLGSRVHDTGGWCMAVRGGSAYLQVEANALYACLLGFQVGGESNFAAMRAPWLHYEAYGIRFINNIVYDIPGAPLRVAGGYNILIAQNTLYQVGTAENGDVGYTLFEAEHGGRLCVDSTETGGQTSDQACGDFAAAGGWGPASTTTEGGRWIPNRSVLVYNNIFYNPAPARTHSSHFAIEGAVEPPQDQHIPNPANADDNLQIYNNIIWNGPADLPLGIEDGGSGCQPSNPTCSADGLRANNHINRLEPQLIDPANHNLHPDMNGNLMDVGSCLIPDFSWEDAPAGVPAGETRNGIDYDYDGLARLCPAMMGAFDS